MLQQIIIQENTGMPRARILAVVRDEVLPALQRLARLVQRVAIFQVHPPPPGLSIDGVPSVDNAVATQGKGFSVLAQRGINMLVGSERPVARQSPRPEGLRGSKVVLHSLLVFFFATLKETRICSFFELVKLHPQSRDCLAER